MDEVFVRGRGWMVHVPEAPSKQPCVRVTDKRYKVNPIHDPDFVARALEIANVKAEQVRARIASDWPRRSTMPDAKGCAVHPINGGSSDTWFCLHCDEQSSAKSWAQYWRATTRERWSAVAVGRQVAYMVAGVCGPLRTASETPNCDKALCEKKPRHLHPGSCLTACNCVPATDGHSQHNCTTTPFCSRAHVSARA